MTCRVSSDPDTKGLWAVGLQMVLDIVFIFEELSSRGPFISPFAQSVEYHRHSKNTSKVERRLIPSPHQDQIRVLSILCQWQMTTIAFLVLPQDHIKPAYHGTFIPFTIQPCTITPLPQTPVPSWEMPMTLVGLKEQGSRWHRRWMVDEKSSKSFQYFRNGESLNRNTEPDRVASHFTLTILSFLETIKKKTILLLESTVGRLP